MTTNNITLRAIEPSDLDQLYKWENDDRVWFSSNITRPLSKQTLQIYIDSIQDIFTDKQVRLIIDNNGVAVGCIDLFDFDPLNQRAGVGIMIDTSFENDGHASKALKEIKKYAFEQLGLHQLYCNIEVSNTASLRLFENMGFLRSGIKKEWNLKDGIWVDEVFLQKIYKTKTK